MSEQIYLTASQVCRRYGGISDMTLWRWLRDAGMGFPQPIYVNRRRLWSAGKLDDFDQRMAAPEVA